MATTAKIGIRLSTRDIDRHIENLRKMNAVADKYADIAVAIARRYVRVDTGALQASIRKEVKLTAKSLIVRILAGEGLPDERAPANEYGTSRMRAQPYIRPALQQIRAPLFEELRQLMR